MAKTSGNEILAELTEFFYKLIKMLSVCVSLSGY